MKITNRNENLIYILTDYGTNDDRIIADFKNRNDAVINQALSYLKWLKTQKPEFFQKLMIDKLGQKAFDEIGLDWKNPRVICIAESFSRFDLDTVHFVNTRIELIRYRMYEDGVFSLEALNVLDATGSPEVKIEKPKSAPNMEEESVPDVENFLQKSSPAIKAIYEELRERILSLDEAIIEKPTTLYVGYRMSNNFADVHFQKNALKVFLRPVEYDDPRSGVKQIPDGYNWKLNKFFQLTTSDDIEYLMGLIEQSYKDVL